MEEVIIKEVIKVTEVIEVKEAIVVTEVIEVKGNRVVMGRVSVLTRFKEVNTA